MDYIMKAFTKRTVNTTKERWRQEINDEDLFDMFYAELFRWVYDHIDYSNEYLNSYAYGVFKKTTNSSSACAIVEIIQRKHGKKVTKLLKLDVSPSLSDEDSISALNELVLVIAEAIKGTIEISGRNNSNMIKIYGRTGPMLGVLRELDKTLSENPELSSSITTRIAGRWLEVDLN